MNMFLTAGIAFSLSCAAAFAAPLKVCTTLPCFGTIVSEIGGDQVDVTTFVKGRDNPHFLEARPAFIKALNKADLLIYNGLDLEVGWLPPIIKSCGNRRVQTGGEGHLDASAGIRAKSVPHNHSHHGPLDRSHGDVHPGGNPHYMLDPVYGLMVADAIAKKLQVMRPSIKDQIATRHQAFRTRIAAGLVGNALAKDYDAVKLALLHEHGRLDDFLKQTGRTADLGGWIAKLHPYANRAVASDHDGYLYLSDRFRLQSVASLEPKPGVTPSTRHLREDVAMINAKQVGAILSASYFPPRYANFVAGKTNARVAAIAHQVGSQAGTSTYYDMVNFNVNSLARALR
jgi:zinc/manganese transport system substrate-binding protein